MPEENKRLVSAASLWSSSEPGWKQTYLWWAAKHNSVVSHLFWFFILFTDADGKVTLPSTSPLLPRF